MQWRPTFKRQCQLSDAVALRRELQQLRHDRLLEPCLNLVSNDCPRHEQRTCVLPNPMPTDLSISPNAWRGLRDDRLPAEQTAKIFVTYCPARLRSSVAGLVLLCSQSCML